MLKNTHEGRFIPIKDSPIPFFPHILDSIKRKVADDKVLRETYNPGNQERVEII